MKRKELVLLYQFPEDDNFALLKKTLHKMGIETKELGADAWREKIGYLLGIKGFRPTKPEPEETFAFDHEVMIMQNIRNKRLDAVLLALKEAGVRHVKFKAVVTPFNTFWTLKRVCENMQKEHAFMMEQEDRKVQKELEKEQKESKK